MKVTPPPMLLAHSYEPTTDPAAWLMSEKLDGVRAWWDGHRLVSRQGSIFSAPDWFVAGLPADVLLDGELWAGRGRFDFASGTVRKRTPDSDEWRQLAFVVFDAPRIPGPFAARLEAIAGLRLPSHVKPLGHTLCRGREHLASAMAAIIAGGGEGLMLRRADSKYTEGRSHDLLKVKPDHDAEATVVGYESGKGKHVGRVGALIVEAGGKRFGLGTGLTDAERANPPAIGALVTYKYTELTPGGIPRFPRFLRVRLEV